MTDLPRWGEMWWCEMPEVGIRPVVVLSRDSVVSRRRWVIVAPCSTKIRGLASEVVLEPEEDPVPRPTAVTLDSVENVSVAMLVERMGALSGTRMGELCAALEVAVGCGRT